MAEKELCVYGGRPIFAGVVAQGTRAALEAAGILAPGEASSVQRPRGCCWYGQRPGLVKVTMGANGLLRVYADGGARAARICAADRAYQRFRQSLFGCAGGRGK